MQLSSWALRSRIKREQKKKIIKKITDSKSRGKLLTVLVPWNNTTSYVHYVLNMFLRVVISSFLFMQILVLLQIERGSSPMELTLELGIPTVEHKYANILVFDFVNKKRKEMSNQIKSLVIIIYIIIIKRKDFELYSYI